MALVSVNIPKSTEAKLNSVLDNAQQKLDAIDQTRVRLDEALEEHVRLARALRQMAEAFSTVVKKEVP